MVINRDWGWAFRVRWATYLEKRRETDLDVIAEDRSLRFELCLGIFLAEEVNKNGYEYDT